MSLQPQALRQSGPVQAARGTRSRRPAFTIRVTTVLAASCARPSPRGGQTDDQSAGAKHYVRWM